MFQRTRQHVRGTRCETKRIIAYRHHLLQKDQHLRRPRLLVRWVRGDHASRTLTLPANQQTAFDEARKGLQNKPLAMPVLRAFSFRDLAAAREAAQTHDRDLHFEAAKTTNLECPFKPHHCKFETMSLQRRQAAHKPEL